MIVFSDAGNAQNPALLVLTQMGYHICAVYGPERDDVPSWVATEGETTLEASSPVALLGIALLATRP